MINRIKKLLSKKNFFNVTTFTFYNSMGSNGWLNYIDKKIIKEIKIVSRDINSLINFLISEESKYVNGKISSLMMAGLYKIYFELKL